MQLFCSVIVSQFYCFAAAFPAHRLHGIYRESENSMFFSNITFAYMPATALKDYYKILEIEPDASTQEVKKAYRAMALKYHPDAAPDDVFAANHFHDAQEAYGVLGNEEKRRLYDNDRWLAGMTARVKKQEEATPAWILQEAIKLNSHMGAIDVYRMHHKALHDYILQLLNNKHMTMLLKCEEPSVNESIIDMLLLATRGLKYELMQPIASLLTIIAGNDNTSIIKINAAVKNRQSQARWEQQMPYVIALVTLLVVLAMYFWVKR